MKATISAILAAIFWGLNFHFAKIMLSESDFIESGMWRYIFGVLIILIFLLLFSKEKFNLNVPFKGILLVGFIGLFGFNLLFFSGMMFTSPLNASLIVSLNPITTILLSSVFLDTEIKSHHIIGAIVSLIGVVVLLTKGQLLNLAELRFNKGDLLIFTANVVFAFHHVWVKIYKKDIPNLHFTAYTNILCLIGFLLVIPFFPTNISIDHSNSYWLSVIGIGMFGTAFAYILWNYGISVIGANRAGIYMNIVPLATAVTSFLFGEKILGFHIYSGLIIILGVLIIEWNKLKATRAY